MGRESETMMENRSFILLFITFIAFASLANGQQDTSPSKKPKLLFATTKWTTSTLTDTTICWKPLIASATAVLACKKKKRNLSGFIEENPISELDSDEIQVTRSLDELEDDMKVQDIPLVDSGKDKPETGRDAKFLYYWATISETYTFTTFTSTALLQSLVCTPPSFTYSLCTGF